MACNRFTVLTLLLAVVHAADECEGQSFVKALATEFERVKTLQPLENDIKRVRYLSIYRYLQTYLPFFADNNVWLFFASNGKPAVLVVPVVVLVMMLLMVLLMVMVIIGCTRNDKWTHQCIQCIITYNDILTSTSTEMCPWGKLWLSRSDPTGLGANGADLGAPCNLANDVLKSRHWHSILWGGPVVIFCRCFRCF